MPGLEVRVSPGYVHHRYDVIILINGVSCAEIGLKALGVNPRRAMGQIVEDNNNPFSSSLSGARKL